MRFIQGDARRHRRCVRNLSKSAYFMALLSLTTETIKHSLCFYTCTRTGSPLFIHAQSAKTSDESLLNPINYYELLDLESSKTHRRPKTLALHNRRKRSSHRARISQEQIKKAYRKQAQLYHPDKLAARRLKQEKQNIVNNTKINITIDRLANMTIEEATSIFTRIAEAYQVLSDPVKRREYDWELLDTEDEHEEERILRSENQRSGESRNDMVYEKHGRNMAEYDSFPLYEMIRNGASTFDTWKNSLNLDPWVVFENFFFQESTMGREGDYATDPRSDSGHFRGDKFGERNSRPSRSGYGQRSPHVSETTTYRGFDPGFNSNVYTVLRREDYVDDDRTHDGKYFYRIMGQDFVEGNELDPFGFVLREYYSAVTEPYLVEEGYTNTDDYRHYDAKNDASHNQKSRSNHEQQRISIHRLEPGEFIVPARTSDASEIAVENNKWISPNGKYEAILTSTCELQIHRKAKPQELVHDRESENVVWSSETYIPHKRANGCHLALSLDGKLVLSVDYGSGLGGLDSRNNESSEKRGIYNSVLWSSPPPPVVPHLFQGENDDDGLPVSLSYYASLDNDGVIAVYRVRTQVAPKFARKATNARANPGKNYRDEEEKTTIFNTLSSIFHRISKASAQQNKTKAAFVWSHVRDLRYDIGKLFTARPSIAGVGHGKPNYTPQFSKEEDLNPSVKGKTYHECIYSTSPAGCLSPGRHAIHFTRKITQYVKHTYTSIDSKLDQFISHLTEEDSTGYDTYFYNDEDDEDVLDTLIRVTGAAGMQLGMAGRQLGKAGRHAALLGMKHGKRVAGKVVGKMKKYSVKLSEKMLENGDIKSYF